MSVLNQLAGALKRRDEVPNRELAKAIAQRNDNASHPQVEKVIKKIEKQVC